MGSCASLGVVIYALTRQVGILFERIAPAGALSLNQNLEVGELAPELSLQTIQGTMIDIGGERKEGRAQLLFFLSPNCPVCKNLLPSLRTSAKDEATWLDVILASDGDNQNHQGFIQQYKLEQFPYIVSELLGKQFGISKLPYAVLIDEKGTLSSLGIVNSKEHLDSLFEAKERKVASLQEYMKKRNQLNHGVVDKG